MIIGLLGFLDRNNNILISSNKYDSIIIALSSIFHHMQCIIDALYFMCIAFSIYSLLTFYTLHPVAVVLVLVS